MPVNIPKKKKNTVVDKIMAEFKALRCKNIYISRTARDKLFPDRQKKAAPTCPHAVVIIERVFGEVKS